MADTTNLKKRERKETGAEAPAIGGQQEKSEEKGRLSGLRAHLALRKETEDISRYGRYWELLEKVDVRAGNSEMSFGAAVAQEIETKRKNGTYQEFKETALDEAVEVYLANNGQKLPVATATVLENLFYGEHTRMQKIFEEIKDAAGKSAKEFARAGRNVNLTVQTLEYVIDLMALEIKAKQPGEREGRLILQSVYNRLDALDGNMLTAHSNKFGLRDDAIALLIDGAEDARHRVSSMLEHLGGDKEAQGVLLLIREGVFDHRLKRSELPYQ